MLQNVHCSYINTDKNKPTHTYNVTNIRIHTMLQKDAHIQFCKENAHLETFHVHSNVVYTAAVLVSRVTWFDAGFVAWRKEGWVIIT